MLSYNPDTGEVRRIFSRGKPCDLEAGTFQKSSGYICIQVGAKIYKAHRLVWLLHFGCWPSGELDHINGIKHDNRLQNLRDVSHPQNCANRVRPNANNTSGQMGVTHHRKTGKWHARIARLGESCHLGLFATPEEAGRAYLAALKQGAGHGISH